VNLNVNATLVVDVDSAPIMLDAAHESGETKASIRHDSRTVDIRNRREGVVNDNVHGSVQVQVHVKVDVT
jgi:hypothetical protein